MAVHYKVIERKNPLQPNSTPKHYASMVSTGNVTTRQLAEKIALMSSISKADCMAMLEALLTIIPQEISEGNIVKLGDFGSFRLTIKSNGEATPADVDANSVSGNTLRFNPGKEVKKVLQAIEYKKA